MSGLTEYYCPVVLDDGKPRTMCLQTSQNALGEFECHDPKSGVTTLATTWNPIFDGNGKHPANIPGLAKPNQSCCVGSKCNWVWFFVILLAVILLATWFAHKMKHKTHNYSNSKYDLVEEKERDYIPSSRIVTSQTLSEY